MGVPIGIGPITVEQFYAFTDTRSDEERWELLDGELVLNQSPTLSHQWIVKNLVYSFALLEREHIAPWKVLPGFGVWISETNRPQSDVLILPRAEIFSDPQRRDCRDVIAVFEILSPETEYRDLHWKCAAYTSVPSLTHYAAIAQNAVEVTVFAREVDFVARRMQSLNKTLDLTALGVCLPLSEIYRDMDWVHERST